MSSRQSISAHRPDSGSPFGGKQTITPDPHREHNPHKTSTFAKNSDLALSPPTKSPLDPAEPPRKARGRPSTHGLCRNLAAIIAEDPEYYSDFRDATIACLDPQDENEHFIADLIALRRYLLLESDEAEAEALRNAYLTSTGATCTPDQRRDYALAAAFTAKQVHSILRIRRSLQRNLDQVERLFRIYRMLMQANELRDKKRNDRKSSDTMRTETDQSTPAEKCDLRHDVHSARNPQPTFNIQDKK